MDYPGRLCALRQGMSEHGVDLLVLPLGANLFYLSGVRRQFDHGTDHNAYGDWVCGGYVGLDGPVRLVAPRMGGEFWLSQPEGKPWLADVRLVREPEDPLDVLRETLAAAGLHGTGRDRRIGVDERTWAATLLGLRALLPEAELIPANGLITPLRARKDDAELAALRRASDLTDEVFEAALAALRPGVAEHDVALAIDRRFAELGAEFTSFETGVFFAGAGFVGEEARRAGGRRLAPGDSVMFDFGGVVDGYCSDFGRSAFLGDPPADYLRVHDAVVLAQADAMRAMVAGRCTAAEANAIARRVIADAGYDAEFTHRLGHGIGVTVHEPPFLDGVDQTVLAENMTFTVEPSIVLPGRFGNRIEDVVVVTADGGVPLSGVDRRLFLVA